jgi:hypothetical protein
MEVAKVSDTNSKRLRLLAHRFFAQAQTYSDLEWKKFALFAGLDDISLRRFFPQELWLRMRHRWLRKRTRPVMYKLHKASKTRKEFSVPKIIDGISIDPGTFHSVVGDKWRELRAVLPTVRELLLLTLNKMVAENVPSKELTIKKLFKRAGVKPEHGEWMSKPLREARLKLKKQQSKESVAIPYGVKAREIPGGYLDLEANVWDFKIGKGEIRKDRLREDFAGIAWSYLQRELEGRKLALTTIDTHYRRFLLVADLLGTKVSDVRSASLVDVQHAWRHYANKSRWKLHLRWALQRIFIALVACAESDQTIDRKEMLKVCTWIQEISVSISEADDDHLSTGEADDVVDGCLADIKTAIEFVNTIPEWQSMSALSRGAFNASVVVQWGVALMILLMSFTGLRRGSVLRLKVGDWLELRPEVYAIAWKHDKKKEEKISLLPDILAKMLDDYVRCTEKLRVSLGFENVFLKGDCHGCWCEFISGNILPKYMADFVKRHGIIRDGELIKLNTMILRRTYATRELYNGRNIWLLRLLLGHESISTTMHYVKFERFEHPHQVGSALDGWGRNVLGLWREPVLFDELDDEERTLLLGTGESRRVEGGRCRQESCVKATAGNPPPCTLCEYLVTGPEFLPEWDAMRMKCEQEINQLKKEHPNVHLLAQMRFQFRQFKSNHDYVKNASTEGA